MGERRSMGRDLALPLLAVALIELLTYRLAAPVLRPTGSDTPGLAIEVLENLGLFAFYLSTLLAPVVLVLLAAGSPGSLRKRLPVWIAAAPLAVLAVASQLWNPPPRSLELLLELSFSLALIAIAVSALVRPGDLGVRIGVALFSIPLLLHALAPTVLLIRGEEALFTALPETLNSAGHWAVVLAAAVAPYCFSPRPFSRAAMRPAPLFVGAVVGLFAAVILRKHFEVGAALASYGLGIELGPGLPPQKLALALMGLGTLSWTLVSCFIAPSRDRRAIGVGLALLVTAGYGFAWPMQYALSAVGMLVIADAGRQVPASERHSVARAVFRAPPISAQVLGRYLEAFVRGLEATGAQGVTWVSSTADDGERRTSVRAELDGAVPFAMQIEQVADAIVTLDLAVGDGPATGEPVWTLAARPERRSGAHPPPPSTAAAVSRTGDSSFDRRFITRDAGGFGERLLDDALRARATASIDGWMAYWDGGPLRMRVCPGAGAPLDHPMPITELAFRGPSAEPNPERLVALVALLRDIADRGKAAS